MLIHAIFVFPAPPITLLFIETFPSKFLKIRDNPVGDYKGNFRHLSKGAWTFSDQDHGWQVSDCTAEGLKVALYLISTTQSQFRAKSFMPIMVFLTKVSCIFIVCPTTLTDATRNCWRENGT